MNAIQRREKTHLVGKIRIRSLKTCYSKRDGISNSGGEQEGTEEGNTRLMQKTANKSFASGVVYLQV